MAGSHGPRLRILLLLLGSSIGVESAPSQDVQDLWNQGYTVPGTPAVLPERARAEAVNRMLEDRLENLLPRLMRPTLPTLSITSSTLLVARRTSSGRRWSR